MSVHTQGIRPETSRRSFPIQGFAGAFIIAGSEVALLAGVGMVGVYFTPLMWTGYILFVDALLWLYRGQSLIRSRTREFFLMLPWSIICWLVFEAYNLRLQNWEYAGLPESLLARLVGYAWSFATIFPAILLTAELLLFWFPAVRTGRVFEPKKWMLGTMFLFGLLMLVVPLIVEKEPASKMFALVWMGFAFLLDPVLYVRGRSSIIGLIGRGDLAPLLSLLLSGLCCGILWEFWNYWAAAKWVYSVPIAFSGPKIFELPLLGYLGFLPFAVECYVMNEFLYVLLPKLRRAGKEPWIS